MHRPSRACAIVSLPALALLAGCSIHNTATHWNGHLGADGQPVFVRTSTYIGMNLGILVPLVGRTTVDEMIDEATALITAEDGSHLRLVETETNNYWYGLPPLSWLLSPVVTSISFEYRPTAQAVAKAAAVSGQTPKRDPASPPR